MCTTSRSPRPPDGFPAERRRVLDDLNLAMLFVDAAEVFVHDESTERRLTIDIRASSGLSPAATAALLCRLLHDRRIPSVEIVREDTRVRLHSDYLLPNAAWRLEVTAPVT